MRKRIAGKRTDARARCIALTSEQAALHRPVPFLAHARRLQSRWSANRMHAFRLLLSFVSPANVNKKRRCRSLQQQKNRLAPTDALACHHFAARRPAATAQGTRAMHPRTIASLLLDATATIR
jgi:hypothetical protein